MEANAAELCNLLVKEIYGEVSSKVVAVLFEYGRLPLVEISRRTQLSQKIVKQTLVVLIQQHLVLHYTQREGIRDVAYYENNGKQIYHLLHAGRVIQWIADRYDADTALLIQNLLQFGHAKVGDFLSAFNRTSKAPSGAGFPGPGGKAPFFSLSAAKSRITELYKARILVQVKEYMMMPKADVMNELRAKGRREMKSQGRTDEVKIQKDVEKDLEESYKKLINDESALSTGIKRKAPESPAPEVKRGVKRQKASAKTYNVVAAEGENSTLDDSIVLRVNMEKFVVFFRNQDLVELVKERIGAKTARVYEELLKHLENKLRRCRDPVEMDIDAGKDLRVTSFEICKTLPLDVDLEGAIAPMPKTKTNGITKKRKRPKKEDDDDDDVKDGDDFEEEDDDMADDFEDDMSDEDDADAAERRKRKKNLSLIKEHLELLSHSSIKFVKQEGTKGAGEWSVNFPELARFMRQYELEKVVDERFGKVAVRLVRILADKGKLDEKTLADCGLMKQRDIRSKLLSLHDAGHIQLQEVPKSLDRHPNRTIFLWSFEPERAYNLLLNDTYKGMARAIQRLEREMDARKSLLAKATRTDVIGKEDEFLNKEEKAELAKIRNIQEKMWAQIFRMDRQVLILRDY